MMIEYNDCKIPVDYWEQEREKALATKRYSDEQRRRRKMKEQLIKTLEEEYGLTPHDIISAIGEAYTLADKATDEQKADLQSGLADTLFTINMALSDIFEQ